MVSRARRHANKRGPDLVVGWAFWLDYLLCTRSVAVLAITAALGFVALLIGLVPGAGVAAWAPFVALPPLVIAREFSAPQRRASRLRRLAAARLPDGPGTALVIGIAQPLDALIKAPYSNRLCLAYWATLNGVAAREPGRTGATLGFGERRRMAISFVIGVGDVAVLVDTQYVTIVRDPRSGEGARVFGYSTSDEYGNRERSPLDDEIDIFMPMNFELFGSARHQEILLEPGDEVVVRGDLHEVEEPDVGLFRSASRPRFHIRGTPERPVEIVLPGKARGRFDRRVDSEWRAARKELSRRARVVRRPYLPQYVDGPDRGTVALDPTAESPRDDQ